jgi:hypothetical protein
MVEVQDVRHVVAVDVREASCCCHDH